MQARRDGRELPIRSRHGTDLTDRFLELGPVRGRMPDHRVLLDVALVCLDEADGRPSFPLPRRRLLPGAAASGGPARCLAVFDVLHLEGRSTCGLPYAERRGLLEDIDLRHPCWHVGHVHHDGEALVRATAARSLEGVVSKRLDSVYRPGQRSRSWRKAKHRRQEDLVVTRWVPEQDGLEAILVARRAPDAGAECPPLSGANGNREAAVCRARRRADDRAESRPSGS